MYTKQLWLSISFAWPKQNSTYFKPASEEQYTSGQLQLNVNQAIMLEAEPCSCTFYLLVLSLSYIVICTTNLSTHLTEFNTQPIVKS